MAKKDSQVKLKTLSRYATIDKKKQKKADIFYVLLTTAAFAAISAGMILLPRTEESTLEQRKLAEFPRLTRESILSGDFSEGMTLFFSDTVPMRDRLMGIAAVIQEYTGFRSNNIKLHNVTLSGGSVSAEGYSTETAATTTETEIRTTELSQEQFGAVSADKPAETAVPESISEAETMPLPETEAPPEDDNVNILNNGIAVVGTRAIMLYGGNYSVGEAYANVVGKYKEALGRNVNVYCMVIPTSSEFYCPASISSYNASQLDNIKNIYSLLSPDVKSVDAYSALRLHTDENIYFRTDHHWSSLGAYYAAREFASAAGVPFAELSDYEKRTVDGYVGTMYSYTQDIAIKNNPEEFFYYVPKDIDYTVTYYNYILGDGNSIQGMSKPVNADFFLDFSNSKTMLYCTFMGGDAKITHVNTSAGNGRRLAIFKDSYGNALPQFLFGSFEDIYIIDMRYFTYNAVDYLKEKGITDVLFANNAFHATTRSTVNYYERILTQGKQVAPAQTAAPATTTAPPATTTAPPATTTAPPKTTTAPPTTTTAPPTTTTAPPTTTTAPPETTTVPPETTKEAVVPDSETESDVISETTQEEILLTDETSVPESDIETES